MPYRLCLLPGSNGVQSSVRGESVSPLCLKGACAQTSKEGLESILAAVIGEMIVHPIGNYRILIIGKEARQDPKG
jgi:hypothetical protein